MAKWDAAITVRSGKRGRPKICVERGFSSRESAETFARNCFTQEVGGQVTAIMLTNVRVSE